MRHTHFLLILIAVFTFSACTNKIEQEISGQVTTENKTAYIDGFNVYDTFAKNSYVRFTMEGSGVNIATAYSSNMLTDDMLPYYFALKTPVRIGSFKDYSYFNFGMYVARVTTAEGQNVIWATIKAADMDGKTRYTVTDPDTSAKVDIVISYK